MTTHGANLFDNYDAFREQFGVLDLYQLDRVTRLVCQFTTTDDVPELELGIDAHWPGTQGRGVAVSLVFEGVRKLELPPLGGQWFGFSELEAKDIASDGLEGLRLSVEDYGSGLRFVCRSAVLFGVERLARP